MALLHPLQARLEAAISADACRNAFPELISELARWQSQHNPSYRRFAKATLLDRNNDWQSIPAVPTRAFKEPFPLTCDSGLPEAVFLTSGTTRDQKGRHELPSTAFYHRAVRQGWRGAGLPTELPFLFLTPSPTEAPHSSLAHMFGVLADGDESRFLLKNSRFELRALFSNSTPIFIAGTALAFLDLMERHSSIPLPPGSWLLETGGYKGTRRAVEKADLYQQLSAFFDVPDAKIVNEYGMTELSSQAYATGTAGRHRFPSWCRPALTCPRTGRNLPVGETGYLRLYDLANAWTVSAIQTQDFARLFPDGSFQLLGRDPDALPRGCSRASDDQLRDEIITISPSRTKTDIQQADAPIPLELLAEHQDLFAPWTGPFDLTDLQTWQNEQLFAPSHLEKRPLIPQTQVHILSGNTPHAAYQSLLAGLVSRAKEVRLKLPSRGLGDFENTLPTALKPWITTSRTLPDHWLTEADAVVVYGSDATIAEVRAATPLEIPFVGHGHRFGVALIEKVTLEAAALAAQDITEHEQAGCLSLQTIFCPNPAEFAQLLYQTLENAPPPSYELVTGAVTNFRLEMRYLAAQIPEKVTLHEGKNHTVLVDFRPDLEPLPGGRTVAIKPLETFRDHPHLSGIGLYPWRPRPDLPGPRLFTLGQAQHPPFGWHHDGWPPLASLVRFQTVQHPAQP